MKAIAGALVIIVALVAAGCATAETKQYRQENERQRALAMSGAMKWSDYYKGAYKRTAELPGVDDRAEKLTRLNILIGAALDYEKGAISKDAFEAVQREVQIAEERRNEQQRKSYSKDVGNALKAYGDAAYGGPPPQIKRRPDPCYQDLYGQTICK